MVLYAITGLSLTNILYTIYSLNAIKMLWKPCRITYSTLCPKAIILKILYNILK
jgi:hypothetical protein